MNTMLLTQFWSIRREIEKIAWRHGVFLSFGLPFYKSWGITHDEVSYINELCPGLYIPNAPKQVRLIKYTYQNTSSLIAKILLVIPVTLGAIV
jgi:hypothetical protein